MPVRNSLCLLACAAAIGLPAHHAVAQAYPSKTIRIIVAFAPGGGTDMLSRVIAQKLQDAWGQSVVVENRAGASGRIGTELVARAAPDGYTLLGTSPGPFVISPSLTAKQTYSTTKDFAPITMAATYPQILVAHPSVPAKSVKELLALAKARPGKLIFAAGGYATPSHLSGELFKMMTGIDALTVGYNGTGAAHIGIITGDCDLTVANLPSQIPHIRSGRLRAIGLTSLKRSSLMPEVPTIDESGVPGYESGSWFGMLGPANMPQDVHDKLYKEIVRIVRSDEFKTWLQKEGAEVAAGTPADFMKHMVAETAKWAKVIKAAKIESQ
jgi:tripartite-type tricarboxylate transporter receptor subunit TctC